MTGAPFLFAFLFWSRGLFEVPAGDSRSPSGGDTAALRKALVMDAVCRGLGLLWDRRWEGCGGGVTSEAFSHGSLQNRREMQYIVGNPAPSLLLQHTRHARMHSGDCFWPLHPQARGHRSSFAATVTCGDVSDSIWGLSRLPPPPRQRVQAGCPLHEGRPC